MPSDYESDPAVSNLRNYLRIRSVQPNVNYDECLTYLRGQAAELGLPVQVFEPRPRKPILVMTWEGLEPALPSVLLNSHMDVVPVFEKSWTFPPFEAHLENGVIYGRGAQDMKSVAIQYIEAVRRLKAEGIRLKRTLHLSFVPDEEIGGGPGMSQFVKTEDFKKLNIGFALDEGIASATDEYLIFNAERNIWHMTVVCPGKSGHGSLLLPDNCGEKIRYIIDKLMDLRLESKKKLADNPELTIGDVTSVNLTKLSGGIQSNVVPEKLTATFDIRIALSVDLKEFESTIRRWCVEAGQGVTIEFEQKDPYVPPTKLDDTNPYWLAFKGAADQLKIKLKQATFTGGTDSRFLRELGIPAIGFSPMSCTTPALHEHNESISARTFLHGIGLYETIIPAVANV
ncbi:aminoacylase-1-like [Trichoplusia ni]|uniref:N-acyl-aliphatic-L-amino acid amidohydrolase n=1 Tax=Trichoplusia ni TaxID=7111 RepID=A0A7E5WWA8_TRINI|nr:aminoacylase-1-like [Trichoplusia ni]